ncbi:unnamed protein product [Calypogeia fissa]
MFGEGGSERMFMEDLDPMRDCTGRVFYDVKSSKVPRCEMANWAVPGPGRMEELGREVAKVDESGIGLLGSDQLLAILQHLPMQALISFGMTCKRYREMADTDALWALICKREWGSRAVAAWPSAGRHKMSWKRLYRQMLLLNAAAWHRVQHGGNVPAPRASHSMNVVNGIITVFGGGCDGGRHLDDSWVAAVPEYPSQGIVWQQVFAGGPSGRFGQSCIVVGNMLMLYGGINDKGTRLGDTWICQGLMPGEGQVRPMWELLEVAAAPPPRGAHGGCFAGDRKVVIFGGIASDGTRLGDTWMLDLAETPLCWREIVTPISPRARSGHTLTWVGGKRIILFGGRGVDFEVMNDVWLLDLESDYPAWVELQSSEPHPGPDHPPPRAGHSATLIFGGRIFIFGGEDSERARKGDVWVLDPSAGFQVTGPPCLGTYPRHSCRANSSGNRFARRFWKKLKQFGRPPRKRSFHAACAVDSGHVILLFGGMVDRGIPPTASAGLGFDGELHMLQLVP